MIIIFPTFLGTPGKKLILGLKLRGGDGGGRGGLVSEVSQTEVSEGPAQFLPNSDTSQD